MHESKEPPNKHIHQPIGLASDYGTNTVPYRLVPTRLPGKKWVLCPGTTRWHWYVGKHLRPLPSSNQMWMTTHTHLQFQIFHQGRQNLFPVFSQGRIAVGRTTDSSVFHLAAGLYGRQGGKVGLFVRRHGLVFTLNGLALTNPRLQDGRINRRRLVVEF